MSFGAGFRRKVDYGTNRATIQRGYEEVNNARQRKLDAEVQKAWRDYEKEERTASDTQELAAIGVQAGLAFYTGGASLAFAPQINQLTFTAMGKGKAAEGSKAGKAASVMQVGSSVYGAVQAEKLSAMDQQHERDMAIAEKDYDVHMANGDTAKASKVASAMKEAEMKYAGERIQAKRSWGDKMFMDEETGKGVWGYNAIGPSKQKMPVSAKEATVPEDAEIKSLQGKLNQPGVPRITSFTAAEQEAIRKRQILGLPENRVKKGSVNVSPEILNPDTVMSPEQVGDKMAEQAKYKANAEAIAQERSTFDKAEAQLNKEQAMFEAQNPYPFRRSRYNG